MAARLLHRLLHLSEGSLREVLNRLNSILKLALAQSGISIEVHSTDNSDQKRITGVNATLNEETLKVAGINETEVAVVKVLVAGLEIVVIARSQVLLEHL